MNLDTKHKHPFNISLILLPVHLASSSLVSPYGLLSLVAGALCTLLLDSTYIFLINEMD